MNYIYKITADPVVDFAAEELKKYLRMMMPRSGDYKICYDPSATSGFRLGLMADFGLSTEDVEDPDFDDVFHVDTGKDGGIIAGSNPRSILLSVYQYLKRNGCRWLFPGIDGEYIPMTNVKPTRFHIKPVKQIRAQCNEGAESQRSVLDSIDFVAKLGMNTFMLEFDNPFVYYNWFYNHAYNPAREPEPVTKDTVLQWKRATETEIAKRGLRFFDMGHGWTTDAIGISSADGWSANPDTPVPEENRKYLAMIDGKRELCRGVALNTNLCMSNPEARALMVKKVVAYAKQAENVDYLKISLADYMNNHCECEECQKMRPSDWYVVLLNEIDEALINEGLDVKLGFTMYSDTAWEPEHETLKNKDHFLCNLAPITRKYTKPVPVDPHPTEAELTPYIRNKTSRFDTIDEYVYRAKLWQKQAGCKQFVYEYHFWKPVMYCPSCLTHARMLYNDVRAYHQNGFIGMMEDSSQRNYFPNAVSWTVYAETLMDPEVDFDTVYNDYFRYAYGDAAEIARDFFEKMETYFPQELVDMVHSKPINVEHYHNPAYIPGLKKAVELCDEFAEVLKPYRNMPYRVQTVAIRLVSLYAEYLKGLANAFILKEGGDDAGALQAFNEFFDDFGKHERDIDPYYDQYLARASFRPIFNSRSAAPDM